MIADWRSGPARIPEERTCAEVLRCGLDSLRYPGDGQARPGPHGVLLRRETTANLGDGRGTLQSGLQIAPGKRCLRGVLLRREAPEGLGGGCGNGELGLRIGLRIG